MSWNMMLVRGSGEGNKTNTRRKLVERQEQPPGGRARGKGLWNMKRKNSECGDDRADRQSGRNRQQQKISK